MRHPRILFVLPLLAAFACDDPSGTVAERDPPRLELTLEVDSIAVTDTFDAVISVTNLSRRGRTITSSCGGAVYMLGVSGPQSTLVMDDGRLQACVMMTEEIYIAPGRVEKRLRLSLGSWDGYPLNPGEYTIRASAVASPLDDSGAITTITAY